MGWLAAVTHSSNKHSIPAQGRVLAVQIEEQGNIHLRIATGGYLNQLAWVAAHQLRVVSKGDSLR
jgi:hypothetical protein